MTLKIDVSIFKDTPLYAYHLLLATNAYRSLNILLYRLRN